MRTLKPGIIFVLVAFSAILLHAQTSKSQDSLRMAYQSAKAADKNMAALQLARALLPDSLAEARMLLRSVEQSERRLNLVEIAELNNILGLHYWFTGAYDSALFSIRKTTRIDTLALPIHLRAEALNNTGTLHNILGNIDSAIHYATLALKIDEQRNNKAGMAKSHYDLSSLFRKRNKYELAARHAIQSVRLNEENNDYPRLFNSLNSLANIFLDLTDTANAIETYQRAIAIAEKTGDTSKMALIHSNLSAAMLELGNPRLALFNARQAIVLLNNRKNNKILPLAYFNAAQASAMLGFKDSAESYLRTGWQYYPSFNQVEMAEIYLVKSDILFRLGQIDSARHYSVKAEALGKANELDAIVYRSVFQQASIDSARGKYLEALGKFQLATQLKEKTLNNKHRSRIEELRLLYETDKKDLENRHLYIQNKTKESIIFNQRLIIGIIIILFLLSLMLAWRLNSMRGKLEQQNIVISNTNHQLIELNKTKDKFLSIIAHDLKGPFNALLGLLENLTNEFGNFSDTEKLELLKSLQKTSQNTYSLLVNLLDWARAQREGFSNHPVRVEVSPLVEEVFTILSPRATQKKQQLLNEVPQEAICIIDRNVLLSVLINLVNNAIKFSPHGGSIRVKWNLTPEGKGIICVEDNGIGIPEDKLEHIFELDNQFKRRGTDQETGTGLGLLLVKEFLDVAGGRIQVKSTEGKGSTFCVFLP